MGFAASYCKEFDAEARKAYGLHEGPWRVVDQGLCEDGGADEGIRYYVTLRHEVTGEERELLVPHSAIVIPGSDTEEEIIERTNEILEIPLEEAERRLRAIGL